MTTRVAASYLRPFALRLQALGRDPAPLLKRHELPSKLGRDDWVMPAQVRGFCDDAARLAEDRDFGLNVALTRARGSYGLVEFATRSSANLEAAFEFTVRFAPLMREGLEAYFDHQGGEARYGFACPDDPQGLGRHAFEFKLVGAMGIVRELFGADFAPRRAWFAHAAPTNVEKLAQVMRTREFRFDQPDCGVAFDASLLARPSVTADPALFEFLVRQARRQLAEPRESGFLGLAREKLRRLLLDGAPEAAQLAKAMHMSTRTLQRRLETESTSFQKLLDQVRQELARRHLEHSALEVAEVARLLGYESEKAFLRAFKRWTGTTPAEYRRRSRTRAGFA